MSVSRILKWASGLVLGFAAVVILVLGWVLFTESGTASAWRVATSWVEGLSADHVEGRIGDVLVIRNLSYQAESIKLQLKETELEWQLSLPRLEELLISKLYLNGLTVTVPESGDDPEASGPIDLPNKLPLPIAIAFSDLKISDFQFIKGAQSEPFVINSATLRGRVSAEEVDLRTLQVDSPLFTVEGNANTRISKNYQTTSKLNWSLRASDAPKTRGSLTLDGNLKKINYGLLAALHDENYGDINIESIGHAGLTELVVGNLSVNHGQSAAAISVDGRLAFAEENPTGDFRIHWTALQWPLMQPAQGAELTSSPSWVRSEEGQMTLAGTMDLYTTELRAAIATPQAPGGNIVLSATGNSTSIEIDQINVRALKGVANGTAKLNWQNELQAEFDIQGEHFDPGELFPEWRGDISFSAQGKQQANAIDLDRFTAKGTLRDKAFNLDAAAYYDGTTAHFPGLVLTAGNSRLNVAGKIGDKMDLAWNISSPDLGELYPDAEGEIQGKGTLAGELPWPVIEAELSASAIKAGSYSIGAAQLSASVDLLSGDSSSVELQASELIISGTEVKSIQVTAVGNRDSHSATVKVGAAPANIVLALAGAWEDGVWQGELQSGEIDPDTFASWQLREPQKLRLSADEQIVRRGCWLSQGAQLCFEAARKDQIITAALETLNLPFNYLKPLLAANIEVVGSVSGTAVFSSSGPEQWSADVELKNSLSEISLGESEDQPQTDLLRIEPGLLSVKGNHQQIAASLMLPIEGGGGAQGEVTITSDGVPITQGILAGDIALHIPDISFISIFSKELQSLAGEIKLDLKLLGTAQSPQPSGKLVLNNTSVNLATPGLTLTEIELIATSDKNGSVDYRGRATSGEGSLAVEGNSVLFGSPSRTELSLTGSNVEIWNSADARVAASPDLKIVMNDELIDVRGKITIPQAQITPQELPSGAISASPDQVIVLPDTDTGEDPAADAVQDIMLRVGLVLGDKVAMEGFGFKGRMQGQLDVQQKPNKPMVASGELKILEGEYRAYGQGLVIDEGQVLFAGGPIDNPGLNIRALRRPAKGIVVGVYAKGELRQPEVSLFSEPSMSQSEQLSWLVLGRSMQKSSGAENDYITQAALALGMKGGGFLTKNIGDNIGLDAIGIEAGSGEAGASSDVNQAALVLGKYLTPKLYISYGLGLLDSLSTVKLRYLMTENWNLVTESSAVASGGDISYSFEK